MKIFIGLVLLAIFGLTVSGQAVTVGGFAASTSERIVKNSPFSADAVSESIQTFADGNRIVRSSTSKLYRNGEGRFRRENQNGSGGLLSTYYSYSPLTTILDPVVGHKYQLDSNLKTARLGDLFAATAQSETNLAIAKELKEKAVLQGNLKGEYKVISPESVKEYSVELEKLKGELKLVDRKPIAVSPASPVSQSIFGSGNNCSLLAYTTSSQSKYETKSEKLGTQNIEGIVAEGTRKTTIIPAGAIGNERPIETVYETWFSDELQLIVKSVQTDPRIGEQTYRLTNIVRAEPDPSLFSLPTGYKLITERPAASPLYNKRVQETAAAQKALKPTPRPAPDVVKTEKPKP